MAVGLRDGMRRERGCAVDGRIEVVPCRRVGRAFPGPVGLSRSVGQMGCRSTESGTDGLPGGRDRCGPSPGGIDT